MKRRFVLIAALLLIGLTFVVWRATTSRPASEKGQLTAAAAASDRDPADTMSAASDGSVRAR